MKTSLEPISIAESKRLMELERVIERGQDAAIEVAAAIHEIHDRRLYRNEFSSFRDYCKTKWGIGKSRGYQLIAFAKEVEDSKVSTTVDTPANERQARKAIAARKPICYAPSKSPAPVVDVDDEPPRIKTADEEIRETAKSLERQLSASEAEPKHTMTDYEREVLDRLRLAADDIGYVCELVQDGTYTADQLNEAALDLSVTVKMLHRLAKSKQIGGAS